MAKRVLSCVQGSLADWQAVDQSELAGPMPTNRRYAFDVRKSSDTSSIRSLLSKRDRVWGERLSRGLPGSRVEPLWCCE